LEGAGLAVPHFADDKAAYSKAAAILFLASPQSCDAVEFEERARRVGWVDRKSIAAE
jgi:hypothetical protein